MLQLEEDLCVLRFHFLDIGQTECEILETERSRSAWLDDQIAQAILAGLSYGQLGDSLRIVAAEKNEADVVSAQLAFRRAVQIMGADFGVKRNRQRLARDGVIRQYRAAPVEGLQVNQRHQFIGFGPERKQRERRLHMLRSFRNLLLRVRQRYGKAAELPRRVALSFRLGPMRAERRAVFQAVKR